VCGRNCQDEKLTDPQQQENGLRRDPWTAAVDLVAMVGLLLLRCCCTLLLLTCAYSTTNGRRARARRALQCQTESTEERLSYQFWEKMSGWKRSAQPIHLGAAGFDSSTWTSGFSKLEPASNPSPDPTHQSLDKGQPLIQRRTNRSEDSSSITTVSDVFSIEPSPNCYCTGLTS
jgi:hypothetical protein